MNSILETMLEKYHPENNIQRENAIKEIIQEIALAGLSKGGFFEKAAFYGGTCLRMFHGLNRFSEDLDFALLDPEEKITLDTYFPSLKKEFLSYGIELNIEQKTKVENNNIQSAFLKGNTLVLMMTFFPNSEDAKKVTCNQKIKIKFEVDIANPKGGNTTTEYRVLPSPYSVKVFDVSTLFAGKIHAIICRNYKNNVKGRDYYDYLFYISKGCPINLVYLENKLKNTGGILKENETLTKEKLKSLLKEKFETVNFESARRDVENFISDPDSLSSWNKELFLSTLTKL